MNTLARIAISPDATDGNGTPNGTPTDSAIIAAMVKHAKIDAQDDGLLVRLEMEGHGYREFMLTVEQARSLSLAIIAAVNRQERHSHARRNAGITPLQALTR